MQAAGSIACPRRRSIAAVLAAGAAGVRMGTRFIAAMESNAHPDYVKALIAARAEDSVRTNRFHVQCALCPSTHGVLRQAIEAADAFEGEREKIVRFRGIPPVFHWVLRPSQAPTCPASSHGEELVERADECVPLRDVAGSCVCRH
jgi:nitronate monooxygenase